MLKKIFKIYQVPNMAPSCRVLITPLGFTVSSAFSGAEAALTLNLLFLWLEIEKEPYTRVLKRDEDNAYRKLCGGSP